MKDKLEKALSVAVTDTIKAKPDNPVLFLAHRLIQYAHMPSKEVSVQQAREPGQAHRPSPAKARWCCHAGRGNSANQPHTTHIHTRVDAQVYEPPAVIEAMEMMPIAGASE